MLFCKLLLFHAEPIQTVLRKYGIVLMLFCKLLLFHYCGTQQMKGAFLCVNALLQASAFPRITGNCNKPIP